MLVGSYPDDKMTDIQYEDLKSELEAKLKEQEQLIWNKKLPVIILLEGLCTSGKDEITRKLVNNFEPLTYRVFSSFRKTTPCLYAMGRYWNEIPKRGRVVIYENSWYAENAATKLSHKMTRSEFSDRLSEINTFERQLCDDGYIIVKLFLFTSEKECDERYDRMIADESQAVISKKEKMCINAFRKYSILFDKIINDTATSYCPWYSIDSNDMKEAEIRALSIITHRLDAVLTGEKEGNRGIISASPKGYIPELVPLPLLKNISPSKSMSEEDYKSEVEENQKEFASCQKLLTDRKINLILAFEGLDASGKGGTIKRAIKYLSPSIYEVYPVAAPDDEEISRHYLWRFYNKFKNPGRIIIFDRTWYGRVLVERIEGLTSEKRWSQAYKEINEFEKSICEENTILIKFWIHIDKDEQLQRFEIRQSEPSKQWKISEEDWRNRSKWESYETAADEMIKKTSTSVAPWNVIEGNDKKYARVKVLRTINNTLREKLN